MKTVKNPRHRPVLLTLVAFALQCLVTHPAWATLATEYYNYNLGTTGYSNVCGKDGGTDWGSPWLESCGPFSFAAGYYLSYSKPGYSNDGNDPLGGIGNTQDSYRAFASSISGGTAWMSILLNPEYGGVELGGNYINNVRVAFGILGGFQHPRTFVDFLNDGLPPKEGPEFGGPGTYLLLVKAEINYNTSGHDRFSLWLNPAVLTQGEVGLGQPSVTLDGFDALPSWDYLHVHMGNGNNVDAIRVSYGDAKSDDELCEVLTGAECHLGELATEYYNYNLSTTGYSNVCGKDGGTGWSGPWLESCGPFSFAAGYYLSYSTLGYSNDGNDPLGGIGNTQDSYRAFASSISGGTAWMSILLNPEYGGVELGGNYINNVRVAFGILGGFQHPRTFVDFLNDGLPPKEGPEFGGPGTYLLLVKAEINYNTSGHDRFSLWLNPAVLTQGEVGLGQPSVTLDGFDALPSWDYLHVHMGNGNNVDAIRVAHGTSVSEDQLAAVLTGGVCHIWYADNDGDGYGSDGAPLFACGRPPGYVPVGGDCNDQSHQVFPSAPQTCDGVNNDCLSTIWPQVPSDENDMDQDGFMVCQGDCMDSNAATFPGAPEVNDGLDNECPGDPGYDATDELSGLGGFAVEAHILCWPAQAGATAYEMLRSSTSVFVSDCMVFESPNACFTDATPPPASTTFFYVARPTAPHVGSWGQDSYGTEIVPPCIP